MVMETRLYTFKLHSNLAYVLLGAKGHNLGVYKLYSCTRGYDTKLQTVQYYGIYLQSYSLSLNFTELALITRGIKNNTSYASPEP